MVRCAASWCEASSTESSAKFFKFPDEEDARVDAWKEFADIEGETTGLVLCSDHFAPCYLDNNGDITDIAIPTVWTKAGEVESGEIVHDDESERVSFRPKGLPAKDVNLFSRATYLSDLLANSTNSIKNSQTKSHVASSTIQPVQTNVGSTGIRGPQGPPKVRQTILGPRIIAGARPRIVQIKPDNSLANKVKQTIHGSLATSTPKGPPTQSKTRDTSLLGEFLTFGKLRGEVKVAKKDKENEQADADGSGVSDQAPADETVLDTSQEMEVDNSANLTDQEKAVRTPPKATAVTPPTSIPLQGRGIKPPLTKSPTTPKLASRGIKLPDSALAKVKSPLEVPGVMSVDKLKQVKPGEKEAVRIRLRGSNQDSNIPNSDPKVTPKRVELNIKPADYVDKLTADLVLTPDVPRGAKHNLSNTVELKAYEGKRLLLSRIISDHVTMKEVPVPALPHPIEVIVEPKLLRSMAGRRMVKNAVVNFVPNHPGPSPMSVGNQRPVYATKVTVSESGLMHIYFDLMASTDSSLKEKGKESSPSLLKTASPKKGRRRKRKLKEIEDTDEEQEEPELMDDDDSDTPFPSPPPPIKVNLTERKKGITVQVPSNKGAVKVEGGVVELMKRKLKDYLSSNQDISTVVIVPTDMDAVPGGVNLEKSNSEDEEENDIVATSEESRLLLRRSLSEGMRRPKQVPTVDCPSIFVSNATCQNEIRNELLQFSQHLKTLTLS